MRRFFIISLVILSLFLEVAFFSNVKVFGITPNIFLMLLIALIFIVPEEEIMFYAFFGSLFLDLFAPGLFGFKTLVILAIVFLILISSYYIFSGVNFILLVFLSVVSTLFFDSFSALGLMFSGLNIDIIYYVKNFLVSKIIINSIIVLAFYPLISSIWDRMLRAEGRAKLLR